MALRASRYAMTPAQLQERDAEFEEPVEFEDRVRTGFRGQARDPRPGWLRQELERKHRERVAFFRQVAERQERAIKTGVQVKLGRRWFGPSFVAGE